MRSEASLRLSPRSVFTPTDRSAANEHRQIPCLLAHGLDDWTLDRRSHPIENMPNFIDQVENKRYRQDSERRGDVLIDVHLVRPIA